MSYYKHIELTEEEQELREKLIAMFLSNDYKNVLLGIELLKQQKSELWLETIGRLFRIMYYLLHFEDEQPEQTYGYKYSKCDYSSLLHVGVWCIAVNEDTIEYYIVNDYHMMSVVFDWYDWANDDIHNWFDWDIVKYVSIGHGHGRCMYHYSDEGKHAEYVCDAFIEGLEKDVRKAMAHESV
jgi:hypothetical protein